MNAARSSQRLGTRLEARVHAWIRRHLVDDDPHPVLSRLDRLDGVPTAGRDRSLAEPDRQRLDTSREVASRDLAS